MLVDETVSLNRQHNEDKLLGEHSQIAEKLRAFYTVIQEEEIPDHLLMLLEKLDDAEKSGTRIKAGHAGQNNE